MFAMGLLVAAIGFAGDVKLSGTIIGTELSGDAVGNATTTENTKEMASTVISIHTSKLYSRR